MYYVWKYMFIYLCSSYWAQPSFPLNLSNRSFLGAFLWYPFLDTQELA